MTESGTGDSGQDPVEVNVGFDGKEGKEVTIEASLSVVREFESLDVVTVHIPQEKWTELNDHPKIRYIEENGQTGALDG
ncbi:hypothetical protein [Haladaptatus sp. DFWS20]|uniref:hypothetical protein n=1 Tax=Haladaptatus sp. DFWS20 TaxID=3403467 RepID=UPI003EBA1DBF